MNHTFKKVYKKSDPPQADPWYYAFAFRTPGEDNVQKHLLVRPGKEIWLWIEDVKVITDDELSQYEIRTGLDEVIETKQLKPIFSKGDIIQAPICSAKDPNLWRVESVCHELQLYQISKGRMLHTLKFADQNNWTRCTYYGTITITQPVPDYV
jgi:hypothetical protein